MPLHDMLTYFTVVVLLAPVCSLALADLSPLVAQLLSSSDF
jgi:hypothetical protein